MRIGRVAILDGSRPGEEDLSQVLSIVVDEVKQSSEEVQVFPLRDMKAAHCIGCFGCWIKTPGICMHADAGREVSRAYIQSDTTILFTPVTFGGYASELKKVVDRIIPLNLPFFRKYHGEIHHVPRYEHNPRLVGIGLQSRSDPEVARFFRTLVGRNALNFNAPSYAGGVLNSTQGHKALRQQVQMLLTRADPFPAGSAVALWMPGQDSSPAGLRQQGPARVLLIAGSPKTKSSTSEVLGTYLLDRLQERGWQGASWRLRSSLHQEAGQSEFLSAVDQADLLLLSFPLYIDALPVLVTKALELISKQRQTASHPRPKRLFALSNNGFPEPYQNALALAMCRRFAAESAIDWAGCLALGGGEALSGGEPLTERNRSRPPIDHVIRALDLTAASLAEGRPMPQEASRLMSKSPIPLVPFGLWRWLFVKMANRGWRRQAAEHGVGRKEMLRQPYLL